VSFEGHLNQLQGYVFEQIAAHSLRESGAVVQLPDSSNNPGWDLLVNGEPVQAKCGLWSLCPLGHRTSVPISRCTKGRGERGFGLVLYRQ
jgi:hypothetical protein